MEFIADFHIHSHYSMATSKKLTPEYLDYWGKLKGIKVVGTGDFTHPKWLGELREKLIEQEDGLFKLKDEFLITDEFIPKKVQAVSPRFMLTAEISSIYKKNGKVRKVHNIVFSPSFEVAEKIQQKLIAREFNITSDGRPILGLDSRNLLELCLEVSEDIFFVPAHIWTPWFSALGAKSGFDTIEECFDDLSDHIYAVEMGLSSNPPLNWMCSFLDKYSLIANSDAHSPEKLGRNANIFNCEVSYPAITHALKKPETTDFAGTINMFPQEGKYHYDGHRKCGVCWNPVETLKHNGVCSVCGRKVTIGVTNRIVQLSDRENLEERPNRKTFHSLIPLKEIISEIEGVSQNSKKVNSLYNNILSKNGSEFDVLLYNSPEQIAKSGYPTIAEAVNRMREGQIIINEGFDGEYGEIKVFNSNELKEIKNQESLFEPAVQFISNLPKERKLLNFDLEEYRELEKTHRLVEDEKTDKKEAKIFDLNKDQSEATEHFEGPAMILAGPGTGKTKVLTSRIAYLIEKKNIAAEDILAVTFTNKAAQEMKQRVGKLLDNKKNPSAKPTIATFHGLGYQILLENIAKLGFEKSFSIIEDKDKEHILYNFFGVPRNRLKSAINKISLLKQELLAPEDIDEIENRELLRNYLNFQKKNNLLDLDDMIYRVVLLFRSHPSILKKYIAQFEFILIDEYQDINKNQYELIRLLTSKKSSPNLFIIGDPNQAIYGFRGADIKYIENFTQDYPDTKTYQLKKSYRCSKRILDASTNVITSEANILAGLNKGIKIKIAPSKSDKSEAEFIARKIESMIGGLSFFAIDSSVTQGNKNSDIESLLDFAVLCRTKGQMAAIEKAFNDHSIPYQVIGETPFFRTPPIANIIDVLNLHLNPNNELLTEKYNSQVNMSELSNMLNGKTSEEAINTIVDNYFTEIKENKAKELSTLLELAKTYTKQQELLQYVSLGKSVDALQGNSEFVPIMTLHASKGLEFKCVFITGCEDGLLPYAIFENLKADVNEEARLFYVGMTRAEKYLFLSFAERRFMNGKEYQLSRSPFVDKIEDELLELTKSEIKKKNKTPDNQLNLFS